MGIKTHEGYMHSEFAFCNAAEFIIKKAEEKTLSLHELKHTIGSVFKGYARANGEEKS